ncbi:MAG: hypothetical protein AAFX08_02785 [Pseudomonadota bacterium]
MARVIGVGGNSERGLASDGQTILKLTSGGVNSPLANILKSNAPALRIDQVIYFSWTGLPRDNDDPLDYKHNVWNGASLIEKSIGADADETIIVGWSNGGDTAFKLAKRLGARGLKTVLMTLDPTSLLTRYHSWLTGFIAKPPGVELWVNAYPVSIHLAAIFDSEKPVFSEAPIRSTVEGNVIAGFGGGWNWRSLADETYKFAGAHGETVKMLTYLTRKGGAFAKRYQT